MTHECEAVRAMAGVVILVHDESGDWSIRITPPEPHQPVLVRVYWRDVCPWCRAPFVLPIL